MPTVIWRDRLRRHAAVCSALTLAMLAACTGGTDTGGEGHQSTPPARTSSSPSRPGLLGPRPCGGGFECATLQVPLDRRHARGTLRLSVARETAGDAPRGVLLVLAGGPGQAGVPLKDRILGNVGPDVARAYRVVVLDQRGTGATALRCPALQEAMGFSDLTPPQASAVQDCARRLGPDRELYSTDDVVADLDDLRTALGAEQMTLYGTSYGTFVAEQYALSHPQHTRALVLDSVVPHDGIDPLAVDVMAGIRRILPDACASVGCPGDPVRDLATVVARDHDGPDLLDLVTMVSIVDPTFQELLSAVHASALGSPRELDDLLRAYRRGFGGPADVLSQGLHASALCSDVTFPWGSSAAPIVGRAAAVRKAVAAIPRSALLPFDAETAAGNGLVRQCLPWAPVPDTPLVRTGALPDIPTLLLAGAHDLSTPLEWARREARLAPGGRLVIVAGAGHSVVRQGGAGRATLRAFLLQ